jgi:hypothetical protein
MRKLVSFLFGCVASAAAFAHVLPEKPAELSVTRLIGVERLQGGKPNQGPDGLSFCFLLSRTEKAQGKLAIKETKDFTVSQRSYREVTQASSGQVSEPHTSIHDAAKYSADHPATAAIIAEAPKQSLVAVIAISGTPLVAGSDVEVRLRVGFGRTAGTPESEELLFRTKVPAK